HRLQRLAAAQAASQPASPPPTTQMLGLFTAQRILETEILPCQACIMVVMGRVWFFAAVAAMLTG
ncbi:MAG: hypothetical protein C4340_06595, partial [Armatimonadota bacterium]